MFEAQYLFSETPNEGDQVFGPWIPRQGDDVTITLDVIQVLNAQIKVELITKNTEDTGDGSTIAATIAATSTLGHTTAAASGVKELVRYKFTVDSDTSNLGGVLFRMLPLVWSDNV